MTRTLYISRDLHKASRKDNLKNLLIKGNDQSKFQALWQIVKESAMGINHENILLTLTTIIPNTKEKRLILLFYYYLENIRLEDQEGNLKDEVLMSCNLIRGHLNHPNEYIRAKTVKTLTKFNSPALFDILKESLIKNITYFNPVVRTAVYIGLRKVLKSKELIGIFTDTVEAIKEQLLKERDITCLVQGYTTVELIDKEIANSLYEQLHNNELLHELFLSTAIRNRDYDRITYIFTHTKDKIIEIDAAIGIITTGIDINIAVSRLLDISNEYLSIREKSKIVRVFKEVVRKELYSFDGMSMRIVSMITPAVVKVNTELANEILSLVLKTLLVSEVKGVFNYLLNGLNESVVNTVNTTGNDKIFYLNALQEIVKIYKISSDLLISTVVPLLSTSTPEVALETAEFLETLLEVKDEQKEKVVEKVVEEIKNIKYGKILRRVFKLISRYADTDRVRKSVNEIFTAYSEGSGLLSGLLKGKDTSRIFPGVSVAQFLLECCKHLKQSKELGVDILAAALKTYAVGYKTDSLDEASKSALLRISCLLSSGEIESALEAVSAQRENKVKEKVKQNLKDRPVFSLVPEEFLSTKKNKLEEFLKKPEKRSLNTLKNIFQLTSAVDPLYAECQIITTRTEIVLDIFLVNQTDMLLENVEFDIVSSENIRVLGSVAVDRIRPHSTCTVEATLLIEESDTGYIGGVITAGKVGRDNYFVQNLQEIQFNLCDMLTRREINKEEFKEKWASLLWENLYSIKLNDPGLTPFRLVEQVVNGIEGVVVDRRSLEAEKIKEVEVETPDVLVQNIYTTTVQGTEIFINATVVKTQTGITGTFRIRGENCRVVKSICQLVAKRVKGVAK